MLSYRRLAFAAVVLPLVAAAPARAQDYNRPPDGFQDDRVDEMRGGYRGGGADPSDPGAMSVRLGKLEGRIRDMTGQIEELQNANRKLVEQVQKFQADVDFRLQGKTGAASSKRGEVMPPDPAPDAVVATPKTADIKPKREGDAFDPNATPTAPGVPKTLGAVAATPTDDAPMDLAPGNLRRSTTTGSDGIAPIPQTPSSTPKSVGGTVTPNGTIIANIAPNSPKEEFDVALGYYKDKQYESAEKGFTSFIQKNPKSRLIADATYYIGESFAQRGRQREAAEQYLKISTDYANSARAPEAMLRLGVSLKALGAKEQACATFTEVGRKYPNAPAYVKTGADREAKRAQC